MNSNWPPENRNRFFLTTAHASFVRNFPFSGEIIQWFILCVLFCTNAHSQVLIPYLENGVYGYCDQKGIVVIPPKYDLVNFFNDEGLALVKKDNLWAWITMEGLEIMYSTSRRSLELNTVLNSGYKPSLRQIKSADLYERNSLPHLRVVYFENHRYQFLNTQTQNTSKVYQKKTLPYLSSSVSRPAMFRFGYHLAETSAGHYDILNTEGEVIHHSETQPLIFDEDLIVYREGNHTVLFNPKVNTMDTLPFSHVSESIDGKYFIVSMTRNALPGSLSLGIGVKSGLSDTDGNLLIDTIYNRLYYAGHGLIVALGDSAVILDLNGKLRSTGKFKSIGTLNERFFTAKTFNDKTILLDSNARNTGIGEFEEIKYHRSEDYYSWRNQDTVGVLDSRLNRITWFIGESIFSTPNPNCFIVSKNDHVGVVNSDQELIIPLDYDRCNIYDTGYIFLEKEGKVGLATKSGEILFKTEFEEIGIQKNDSGVYFRPKKNGLYACYDQDMNQLSGFFSKHNQHISHARTMDWYREDGVVHFTDAYGKPIGFQANEFRSGWVLSDSSYIIVITDHKRNKVLINGHELEVLALDSMFEVTQMAIETGLFAVTKNGKNGVLNHKGEVILPLTDREVVELCNHYIICREQEKKYLYNLNGSLIYERGFDFIMEFAYEHFRPIGNKIEGSTYPFIQTDCTTGIPDTVIMNHMEYGYINRYGEIVVPLVYNDFYSLYEDRAFVTSGISNGNKTSFLIDTLGNTRMTTSYDFFYPLGSSDASKYYIVSQSGLEGVIDSEGRIVIPCMYKSIVRFCGMKLLYVRDENDNTRLINLKNEDVYNTGSFEEKIPFYNLETYESCHRLSNGKFIIFPNGQSEVIDKNGKSLLTISEQDLKLITVDDLTLIEINSKSGKYYINGDSLTIYKANEN